MNLGKTCLNALIRDQNSNGNGEKNWILILVEKNIILEEYLNVNFVFVFGNAEREIQDKL